MVTDGHKALGDMGKTSVDIEELLVWAFKHQGVENYVGALRSWGTHSQGSLGSSIAQTLMLGARVDGGSPAARMLGARCPDDALTVYEAVMTLPPEAWMLVIKHARSGTEPEWYPEGPGRWVQPLDAKGEPKRIWRDPKRRRGDLGPAPSEFEGLSLALVEEARASFRLWHVALCELLPLVNPELERFTAFWPARPLEPWTHLAPVIHGLTQAV